MRMKFGALAQLGERYNGIVEVRGSIPLGSTKFHLRIFLTAQKILGMLTAFYRTILKLSTY